MVCGHFTWMEENRTVKKILEAKVKKMAEKGNPERRGTMK